MEEMWIARDKDGELVIYEKEPLKDKLAEQWTSGGWFGFLPKKRFPEVKWSDKEPTKVKLVIEKNNMDYKAKIEIDVQEAFDELRPKEQKEFIKSNSSVLDIEDLIKVIEANGYIVINE